ncbi:hypothetical protein BTUL_0054g00460 [Botrytis tulipae]|uniref:DUF1214 domain-containing protein n=5 Tax=Sclerotiniaceae TaxID=28983 RepID=A0A4Z1HMD5_9HELO|nr:uncharacterized protein EAE97_000110 [Botrytis byssoidea]KAF7954851.1 hypothetical protein EAE97_000110 [Botrytis byssoidea]TGO14377.1 hypothetical protein BTUL_0054g00460 [Botrytis tulipae]TGO40695.1 hypothetical protein BHYA_0033g00490 [Botrytis hyacinthi]TGO49965.1 hypothetical protein BCON_0195g00210 [Botryotinia convoluta]
MALFLMLVNAIPTVIGTAEALDVQKKEDLAQKHKAKFFMTANFALDGKAAHEKEAQVVLRDNRMYLNHPDAPKEGHRFCGYYFMYPGTEEHGLVSTIQDNPPMLNWIYVDSNTLEVRYGGRADTVGNLAHPWEWSEDEVNLTLEEDEGFVAVEVEPGLWQIYFDRNGDFSGLPTGKKIQEVCLLRRMMCGWNSQLVPADRKKEGG